MERGEDVNYSIANYYCTALDDADIYKVRFDSLCGMDGRKSLPATIRKGYTAAYRMVRQEVHTRFIQKVLIAY